MLKGRQLRQRLGGLPSGQQGKRNYGRIWPNGNFSVGIGPVGAQALEMDGADAESVARWGDYSDLGAAVAALTSSNALNSHTPVPARPQRGLKGISAWGQQSLRSACYLLERDYGKEDLCFATLTVPSLTVEGRSRLAQNWSELVRQLLQWVSRKLISAGRPTKVCGCTEIQTSRLLNHGAAYLHLHVVWPSHSNASARRWVVEWSEIRAWWESALVRFSGESLPHHPRVELAQVKKSAERYLGKYLSKGSGEALEQFIEDLGVESVPPTWWFMTAEMRHQVKHETASGPNTGELLYLVVQAALEDSDLSYFEWVRPVMVTLTDRPVHLGWCGRLTPRGRDDLLTMLAPLLAC